MGYCTRYKIDCSDNVLEEIRKLPNLHPFSVEDNGEIEEPIKWYEYEKDLLEVSNKFQEEKIILYGEGEDSGDIWRAYFLNGKSERIEAKLVFDDPTIF